MVELPQRKHPRLKSFDYSKGGVFCITICTKDKKSLFGYVQDGETACVILNDLGRLVQSRIESIAESYVGVSILTSVVMPNHVHLLLQIADNCGITPMTVVRSFKTIITKELGKPIWQTSFFEHIARSEKEALRYWKYIDENPKKWTLDKYFE